MLNDKSSMGFSGLDTRWAISEFFDNYCDESGNPGQRKSVTIAMLKKEERFWILNQLYSLLLFPPREGAPLFSFLKMIDDS